MRTRWTRIASIGTATGVLALGLAGCGGQPTAKTSHRPFLAVSLPAPSIPFWVGAKDGAKLGAKKYNVKYNLEFASTTATQVRQIESMLQEHPQALVVAPNNNEAIVPAVLKANQLHIPVVLVERGAASGKAYAFVETDNTQVGREEAAWMVKQLTKRYGAPKGNIVVILGPLSTSAGLERYKGATQELKKYPNIHVIAEQQGNWTIKGGYSVMSAVLQKYPSNSQIDGVIGANDEETVGAVRAIEAAHRFVPYGKPGHIFTIGVDGGPVGIHYLEAGKLDAIEGQHIRTMVEEGFKLALNAIHGKPAPKQYPLVWPHVEVTPQNVGSINIWGKHVPLPGA